MDDQVKMNGYRIELSEIENVLIKHELIEMIVVLLRQNKLVAYIKLNSSQVLTISIIEMFKTYASKDLTHYMIPQ